MAKNKIVLLGGGGHAKVIIDLIRINDNYKIAGILDSRLDNGSKVLDIPVIGADDVLVELYNSGVTMACIGVGSVCDSSIRKRLFEKVRQIGFSVPALVHPQAIISKTAKISDGVQIMAGSVVQTNTFLGENTIVNTGSIIEHDCKIGKHVHICPGAIISGGCEIGEGAFIGASATVIQGIKIGKDAVIGAGSVVIKDVPGGAMVKGVPAI
ncbi:MAG: acetyltransferase [Planctomycetes bacterium]|nr:acetyltransferase [Planctomycetota bacterium]